MYTTVLNNPFTHFSGDVTLRLSAYFPLFPQSYSAVSVHNTNIGSVTHVITFATSAFGWFAAAWSAVNAGCYVKQIVVRLVVVSMHRCSSGV